MSTAVALSLAGVVGAAVFAQVIATEPDRSRRRASGGQMGLFPDETGTPLFAGRAVTQSVTPSGTQSPAADVVIRHTPEGGTVIEGTTRAQADLMKRNRLRWWREGGVWYVPNTRDKRPDRYRLDQLATAFRDAGLTVEIEVENTLRPTAEREAARAERLEERADRLEARAERVGARGQEMYERSNRMADAIPLGQPIMVGHYSEGRDRNYREKMRNLTGRAFETLDEARETARRAESSRTHQAYRETLPVTLRRIAKLEAEQRGYERELAEGRDRIRRAAASKEVQAKYLYRGMSVTPYSAATVDRLNQQVRDVEEELTHWRAHAAELEAGGVKRWGPSDFTIGDIVNGDLRVLRVNPKSLSVQSTKQTWYRSTLPYSGVRSTA